MKILEYGKLPNYENELIMFYNSLHSYEIYGRLIEKDGTMKVMIAYSNMITKQSKAYLKNRKIIPLLPSDTIFLIENEKDYLKIVAKLI